MCAHEGDHVALGPSSNQVLSLILAGCVIMIVMLVIMAMRVLVVMMGVAVGMIVILGVMMDALRLGGGRIFAEHQ